MVRVNVIITSCANFVVMVTMMFLLVLDDPVDDGNGVYHVSLRGQQIMECALEFQPTEVQTK